MLEPMEAATPAGGNPFGIDDAAFHKERNLLTKLPVRAAGLAALGIAPCDVVWDVGAGSGAVSIEAARLAWRGQVFAFERSPERERLIRDNRKRFATPHLEIAAGSFPECLDAASTRALPNPNKIFIGGGLGADRELARRLLQCAWERLLPGGRLVAHCVLLSSLETARATLGELAGNVATGCLQAAESAPLGGDVRLQALNPVFSLLAVKKT